MIAMHGSGISIVLKGDNDEPVNDESQDSLEVLRSSVG